MLRARALHDAPRALGLLRRPREAQEPALRVHAVPCHHLRIQRDVVHLRLFAVLRPDLDHAASCREPGQGEKASSVKIKWKIKCSCK